MNARAKKRGHEKPHQRDSAASARSRRGGQPAGAPEDGAHFLRIGMLLRARRSASSAGSPRANFTEAEFKATAAEQPAAEG